MFTDKWVRIDMVYGADPSSVVGKVITMQRDSICLQMDTDATVAVVETYVQSITILSEDDEMECETTLRMAKAGIALEELAKHTIKVFNGIMDDLPTDYPDLFGDLEQIVHTLLNNEAAKM